MTDWASPPLVSSDELICNVIQIIADNLRLKSKFSTLLVPRAISCDDLVGDGVEILSDVLRLFCSIQNIVVDALDQPGFPSGRLGSDGVPGVAGDHAHFRGRCPKRLGDLGIGLWRRFVPLGRVINAESAIEKVNNAAMGQLPAGNGCGVVRQSE